MRVPEVEEELAERRPAGWLPVVGLRAGPQRRLLVGPAGNLAQHEDRNGAVQDGPPPEPLAKIAARVDGDRVLVQA